MSFKLNINEPCHENWNSMTPNEKGRFCNQCAKTVHDFTNYAPVEIAEALKNGNGNICGRVNTHMLNQQFAVQAGFGKWGMIAVAGLATSVHQIDSNTADFKEPADKNHIQVNVQSNYYKIAGTVHDENKKPVGGAAVQIVNGETFVAQGYSLSTGNFALFLSKDKTFNGPLTVRITKDGYVVSEETVILSVVSEWKHDFLLQKEVPLEVIDPVFYPVMYETMGDMSYEIHEPVFMENSLVIEERVTGGAVVCTYEPNMLMPVKDTVEYIKPEPKKIIVTFESIDKLNVYPNPANDIITLEFKKDKSCRAMIYNLSGALIKQREFTGTKLQMDVSDLAVGNYIVYVIDNDTQKSYSQKLVVVR